MYVVWFTYAGAYAWLMRPQCRLTEKVCSDFALPGAYVGAGLYAALPIGAAYAAFFNLGETIQGKGKYGQVMVPGSLPNTTFGSLPNTPISGHFQTPFKGHFQSHV